jgi:hypothetical protein
VAAFGCSLFRIDVWSILGGDNGYTIGYWNVEDPDGGGCLDYDSNFADSSTDLPAAWKIGRAAGVLGALLAWIVLALVGAASFYCYPRPILTFRMIGWFMIVLSPTSLLLLIGKATEDGKYFKLAAGGVLAILSSILWVGGAVATMQFLKERPVSLSPTVATSSRHAAVTRDAVRQSNVVDTPVGARSSLLVQSSIETLGTPSTMHQPNVPAAFTTTNTMPTGTTTTSNRGATVAGVAQYLRENTYVLRMEWKVPLVSAACCIVSFVLVDLFHTGTCFHMYDFTL